MKPNNALNIMLLAFCAIMIGFVLVSARTIDRGKVKVATELTLK
jgi:hypothetical protein